MMFTSETIKRQSCDHRKVKGKVRAPMLDGGTDVRCEHQCKQQWTEMATDEYIQIMCCTLHCSCHPLTISFTLALCMHLCSHMACFMYACIGVRTLHTRWERTHHTHTSCGTHQADVDMVTVLLVCFICLFVCLFSFCLEMTLELCLTI